MKSIWSTVKYNLHVTHRSNVVMYFTKSFPDFKNVKDVLPMFMGIIQKACDLWIKESTGLYSK